MHFTKNKSLQNLKIKIVVLVYWKSIVKLLVWKVLINEYKTWKMNQKMISNDRLNILIVIIISAILLLFFFLFFLV